MGTIRGNSEGRLNFIWYDGESIPLNTFVNASNTRVIHAIDSGGGELTYKPSGIQEFTEFTEGGYLIVALENFEIPDTKTVEIFFDLTGSISIGDFEGSVTVNQAPVPLTTLDGTGNLELTGSGQLSATPILRLSGQGNLTLSGQGELLEIIRISGQSNLELTGSGELLATPKIVLSGQGNLALSGSGSLESTLRPANEVRLTGQGNLELAGSGQLIDSDRSQEDISGQGNLELSGSGQLISKPQIDLSGQGNLELVGSGQLIATPQIALTGQGSLELTGSGILVQETALEGQGNLELTGAGILTQETPLAGQGSLELTGSGELIQETILDGQGNLELTGSGQLLVTTRTRITSIDQLEFPANNQLFQFEDATQTGEIRVKGRYSPSTLSVTLQARYLGGNWVNIGQGENGTFDLSYTGIAGQGIFEVQPVEQDDLRVTRNTVSIGELLVAIGDSWGSGRMRSRWGPKSADTSPLSNIYYRQSKLPATGGRNQFKFTYYANDNTWREYSEGDVLDNPLGQPVADIDRDSGDTYSHWGYFAQRLVEQLNPPRPVAIQINARGNTTIVYHGNETLSNVPGIPVGRDEPGREDQGASENEIIRGWSWLPSLDPGRRNDPAYLYGNMLKRFQDSGSPKCRAVIANLGTNDTKAAENDVTNFARKNAVAFAADLKSLGNALRADLDAPLFIPTTADFGRESRNFGRTGRYDDRVSDYKTPARYTDLMRSDAFSVDIEEIGKDPNEPNVIFGGDILHLKVDGGEEEGDYLHIINTVTGREMGRIMADAMFAYIETANDVIIEGSGNLELSGSGTLIGREQVTLTGGGDINLSGSGSLNDRLQESFTGAGNLELAGSGTIIASPFESLSGTGNIELTGSGELIATPKVELEGTGHLELAGSGELFANTTLSGQGNLELTGSGTLTATEKPFRNELRNAALLLLNFPEDDNADRINEINPDSSPFMVATASDPVDVANAGDIAKGVGTGPNGVDTLNINNGALYLITKDTTDPVVQTYLPTPTNTLTYSFWVWINDGSVQNTFFSSWRGGTDNAYITCETDTDSETTKDIATTNNFRIRWVIAGPSQGNFNTYFTPVADLGNRWLHVIATWEGSPNGVDVNSWAEKATLRIRSAAIEARAAIDLNVTSTTLPSNGSENVKLVSGIPNFVGLRIGNYQPGRDRRLTGEIAMFYVFDEVVSEDKQTFLFNNGLGRQLGAMPLESIGGTGNLELTGQGNIIATPFESLSGAGNLELAGSGELEATEIIVTRLGGEGNLQLTGGGELIATPKSTVKVQSGEFAFTGVDITPPGASNAEQVAEQIQTIDTVIQENSFLVFGFKAGTGNNQINYPNYIQVRGGISSNTEICIRSALPQPSPSSISWYVIESSDITVQKGMEVPISGEWNKQIALPNSAPINKSFPLMSLQSYGTGFGTDDAINTLLIDENTLEFRRGTSQQPNNRFIEWQVITIQKSNVQRVDFSSLTLGDGRNITLSQEVIPNQTFLITAQLFTTSNGRIFTIARFNNPNNTPTNIIETDVGGGTRGTIDGHLYAISAIDNFFTVQHLNLTFTNSQFTQEITLGTPIEIQKSFCISSGRQGWGGTKSNNGGTNCGLTMFTMVLIPSAADSTKADKVQVSRPQVSGTTSRITVQIVTFN